MASPSNFFLAFRKSHPRSLSLSCSQTTNIEIEKRTISHGAVVDLSGGRFMRTGIPPRYIIVSDLLIGSEDSVRSSEESPCQLSSVLLSGTFSKGMARPFSTDEA